VLLDGVPTADGGREIDPGRVRWVPDARRIQVGRDPVLLRHDRHLAWVWKPSGWLAVPAPGRHDPSVVRWVAKILGAGLPVHRLDEGTSGVMIVARDETSQAKMKDLFEVHAVERRYLALVRGRVGAAFTRSSTLVRDRGDGLRGSGPGGKPATTHVTPLQVLRQATLIEARLETGRTHQVRIHLAEAGHPLLGDPLYGDGRGAPRLALHAAVIGFVHPRTGERVRVETPLADDLEVLRRRLS
jgi:23S rRNA pseudouridine1911/1915/1917 synthase